MSTREARAIAVEWVESNWRQWPGFAGAYFGGSINVTPEEAPWPKSSDIDITVLADLPRGLSHVHYKDLLLEVSTQPYDRYDLSFEGIVSDFRRAIHFSVPSIIMDPTGRLEKVHRQVREAYPRRKWVVKRCQGAEKRAQDVSFSQTNCRRGPGQISWPEHKRCLKGDCIAKRCSGYSLF